MYFIKQDNKIIPTKEGEKALQKLGMTFEGFVEAVENNENPNARFPANLLVTDDALNDGEMTKQGKFSQGCIRTSKENVYELGFKNKDIQIADAPDNYGDSGSKSRYFDIDVWAEKYGLLQYPKASKSERNAGCEELEDKKWKLNHLNGGDKLGFK